MRHLAWAMIGLVACGTPDKVKLGRSGMGDGPSVGRPGEDVGDVDVDVSEPDFGCEEAIPFEEGWDGSEWASLDGPVQVCMPAGDDGSCPDLELVPEALEAFLHDLTGVEPGDSGCASCGTWDVGRPMCGPFEGEEPCCYIVDHVDLVSID